MKKLILLAAALLPLAAQASTVSLSTSRTGAGLFLSGGTTLAGTGSLIRVGSISNLADPIGTFVEFGAGSTRTIISTTSKITGSVSSALPEANHTQFNGRTIYIWAYNAPTAGAATQQAIFTSTKAFPVNDVSGVGDDVTVFSATELTGVVTIPGWNPGQILAGSGDHTPRFVLGTVVPEPTTTTFSGLAALAFIARRKRA
ncbi:MAG: hypothetical protein DVB22_000191 [Verrucomicrobia bacterium]|nr:MAG: hypothetical protein DVB22_000191 [Verrucomicrobiota bacterium]